MAVAIALDPSLITEAEAAEVTIARGDETRGQLIIDRRPTAAPLNVNLVRRAHAPGYRQVLFDPCAGEPQAITR